MEERKADIKRIIEEQGKLTEELAAEIEEKIHVHKESLVLASKKNKKAAAVTAAKEKAESAVQAAAAISAAAAVGSEDESFEEFTPEEA